jgi:hypothetical protein
MGCLKSTQISHGVAPPRQLPEPPAMDRGIYQLEDGCLLTNDGLDDDRVILTVPSHCRKKTKKGLIGIEV